MAWSWRRRGRRAGNSSVAPTGSQSRAIVDHLERFIASRRGVEGFVEPRTTVTPVTLLLVAHDGEWTRRAVPDVAWAHDFANRHGVPSYDAAVVGIPQRMRDYNRRQRHPEIPDTL
jgi:hypothetical protein